MITQKKRPIWMITFAFLVLFLMGSFSASEAQQSPPEPCTAYTVPNAVSLTLEGCRRSTTTGDSCNVTLPNGAGKFICPDPAPLGGPNSCYTSGNLGKTWNELDLVPYRIIADAGNNAPNSQTYVIAVVLDYLDAGRPGYDLISPPELNTALSVGTCQVPLVSEEYIADPGLGGIDQSIYRLVQITQAKGTTCVYDYYGRLALGSHLFTGSSLHANLALPTTDQANGCITTSGIGARDVSIPVKEISPQELRKDMSAAQDTAYLWNITKLPTPAELNFGNTCQEGAPSTDEVKIRIEWKILPGVPGMVTITANIYAKNPAARTIRVNVSDVIYEGCTIVGNCLSTDPKNPPQITPGTALDSAGPVTMDVPPNTEVLVGTHVFDALAGVTNLCDKATATYTDVVTGEPVPGTVVALACAPIQQGDVTNETATVTDVEKREDITGVGFMFSVDQVTVDPAYSWQFTDYTGGLTVGPVTWFSGTQVGNLNCTDLNGCYSGSVEFIKTVDLGGVPVVTSGKVKDTATLTGIDGFTAMASSSISVSSDAKVTLNICKTIPDILQGSDKVTFNFDVCESGAQGNCLNGKYATTASIPFSAGQTSRCIDPPLTGLDPGYYKVHEVPVTGFDPNSDQVANINLPNCSASLTFNNTIGQGGAHAKVQKVTQPSGFEAGWTFNLSGPINATVYTTGAGYFYFVDSQTQLPIILLEGAYTITETEQAGWYNGGPSGECSFTVDYPLDIGRTFECTFTNYKPSITLDKTGDTLSKVGDDVNYTITLNNTSPAVTPDLSCTITDAKLGINKSVTLASGASDVTNATYTVPAGASDPLINTATATCTVGTVSVTASDDHSVNLFQPSITFAKTADTQLSKVGETVNYTITLNNTSDPDTPSLVCTITDTKLGVNKQVTLASGAGDVTNVAYTMLGNDPDPLVNTASVSCSPTGFPNVLTASSSWTVNLFQPSITFNKTGDILSKIGDSVNYTLTLNNTSSADSPNLTCTINDAMLGINKTVALAAGASDVTNATYTVKAGDPDPLPNTASVSCSPVGFPNVLTASASHSVNLFQPSVSIAKTGSVLSKIGDTVTYNFKITNTSSADSPNLLLNSISDDVLGDLASYAGGCASLAPGAYCEFDVPWTVAAGSPDPVVNTVEVHYNPSGFTNDISDTDSHSLNLFQPSISFGKTADTQLTKVGDVVNYTITLNNTSSQDTPDMACTITDAKLGVNKSVTLAPGAGDVTNVAYTVQAGDPDPLVNTASVTCSPTGFTNVLSASSSWSVNLFQPSVSIAKTGPAYSKAGDTVTYNVTIQNTSSADSPNLLLDSFSDSLVAGVTPPVECGNLALGASCSFSYTYTVQAGDPDPLKNTATAHYHPAGFINDITNSSTWTTDLLHPSFNVSITCNSPDAIPQAGPAVFTVTFNNTGDADMHVVPSVGDPFDVAAGGSDSYDITVSGPFSGTVSDTVTGTVTLAEKYGLTNSYPFTATGECTVEGLANVSKTVSGQPPAAGQTFTFQLRQGASTTSEGTTLEQVNTDASGDILFATGLEPGQTYQICEWVFPGWNTNLAGDGPLFVPNSIIPPSLPNPNVNNLTVCTDFTVTSGQTRTFAVDNTPPPGGRALTIGFWKNWASCSGSKGHQDAMLDLSLAYASQMTTNPPGGLVVSAQNAGSGWPNYASLWYLVLKGDPTSTEDNINPAPNCSQAVNLLDKRTTDGKKKMASDPLFNMAAQLVGAELNRFMGSGISGVTITNIDKAVLLLGKYKFNGLTYSPKLTTADANLANCLARELDNYNNNRPVSSCP